jgi:RNA polymerase sigma factor (sigma-70 family)
MRMAETQPNLFLHQIRHLVGSVPEATLTDRQLLERFLTDRDEAAVDVLVRRYGRLVFGVCRRVLCNAHAAEDAFQATFIVLLRKAPVLAGYERLGNWLYRVAYRLALRARANESRRRNCEAKAARRDPAAEDRATSPGDLVVALEEELQRLPARHRAPLVLCYLEGKTNAQAAEVLGCPRGSMGARLAQARERLRTCLARRGYAVPVGGLASLLTATAADAVVPLPLLVNTVRAALCFAHEEAGTAGFVSTQAVALARSAIRAMMVSKLKIATSVLLTVAMLGTSATLLLSASSHVELKAPTVEQPPQEAQLNRGAAPGEHLPKGARARMGTTRLRHGNAVFFAAYTPDGRALLSAGRDRTVRLWDLATGMEIRTFEWGAVPQEGVPPLALEAIGQRWEQQYWDGTARSCQAALSADGKLVAASRGGVVSLWETATGKQVRQLQTGQKRLVQLAFAADGKSLLTLGPGQAVDIWEVATGRCSHKIDSKPTSDATTLPGFFEQIALVSPGCMYLAFQELDKAGESRSIRIKELTTGKELPSIKPNPIATALTFSADDKILVWFQHSGTIVVSDVATGNELRRLSTPNVNVVADLALSADGKTLAVSRASHSIELWNLTSGQQTGRIGLATDVDQVKSNADILGALVRPALAFSPDSTELVTSLGSAIIRRFHAVTGAELPEPSHGPKAPVATLSLSPDGKSLWTHGHGEPLRRWDWAAGREMGRREMPSSAVYAAFAADGRFAYAEGTAVIICGADGAKKRTIAAGGSRLMALALSPTGASLATRSGSPREIHLWDTTTGKERYTLGQTAPDPETARGVLAETAGVIPPDLVFSPDGRWLAGAGPRRQFSLWDVATGKLLWEVSPQAGPAIECFAFSPSGFCLATVNADRTVTLYDAATGAKRAQFGKSDPNSRKVDLTGLSAYSYLGWRQDAPVCLAFSPDGHFLATSQESAEIHLWDVLAGRDVGQLKGHQGGVVSLLFTPDGNHLISGSTDTTALTWDLTRLARTTPAQAQRLEAEVLDALWADLTGTDATRAFDAIRTLCASPHQAVALLREHVHLAAPPDPQRLALLLADLGSDRFETRRQAEAGLEGLHELAEPGLRQALAGDPPLDLRQRLDRLLNKLSGRVPPIRQLRDLRAVEVLELIGTSEARQLLQEVAGGAPGARLTREATSALQRLTR